MGVLDVTYNENLIKVEDNFIITGLVVFRCDPNFFNFKLRGVNLSDCLSTHIDISKPNMYTAPNIRKQYLSDILNMHIESRHGYTIISQDELIHWCIKNLDKDSSPANYSDFDVKFIPWTDNKSNFISMHITCCSKILISIGLQCKN